MVVWAFCNALSNASLKLNSVGFYQMMKLTQTPVVVAMDYLAYGKRVSLGKAASLAAVCAGVGLATVSDVTFTWAGLLTSAAAVSLGVAQKLLSSHMQQHCGLDALQLMHAAFPTVTLLGLTIT